VAHRSVPFGLSGNHNIKWTMQNMKLHFIWFSSSSSYCLFLRSQYSLQHFNLKRPPSS
jgi:hypothetical protein